MRVVIVDDSAADRRLCRLLLEETRELEAECFEAETAAAGLQTCLSVEPDCVLLDYKLPDMTGIDFLVRLRLNDPVDSPHFAVVLLTGIANDRVAVEALRAGAQDYVVKDRITADGLGLAVKKATEKTSLIRNLKAERDELAKSLAEKEVLLQEVHHRVKNHLQVVCSLLRLQAAQFTDPRMAAALLESQHRVDSMALIHEQLYATGDLREVDLGQHAATLASNLTLSYGVDPARIRCQVAADPVRLGVDAAIPAGLILNELLSNALKHAFPGDRGGTIEVEVARRDEGVMVEVRDDGVGIAADVDPFASRSLGLKIVQILSRQLKGRLELQREMGTHFRVTFPER